MLDTIQPQPHFDQPSARPVEAAIEMSNPELSFVIPFYNEAERKIDGRPAGEVFEETLDRYRAVIDKEFDYAELVGIDDASDDDGQSIIIAKSYCHRVLETPRNIESQRGGALRHAFSMVSGEIQGYTDADGSYSPETMMKFYEMIKNGDYDAVFAHRDESLEGQHASTMRTIGHHVLRFTREAILPTGIEDPQAGMKLMTAEASRVAWVDNPQINGWAADHVAAHHVMEKGLKIGDIAAPIVSHDESTVNTLSEPFRTISQTIQARNEIYDGNHYVAERVANGLEITAKGIERAQKILAKRKEAQTQAVAT